MAGSGGQHGGIRVDPDHPTIRDQSRKSCAELSGATTQIDHHIGRRGTMPGKERFVQRPVNFSAAIP